MPDLVSFFLNSSSQTILYDTIEISHPTFSKVYRIVRNARKGISAKIETGLTVPFDYYPIKVSRTGSNGTLDQSFTFTVGDVGTVINDEIQRCIEADTLGVKPLCIYRAYRSDDLTGPVYGPITLEISDIPMSDEGFLFQAEPWKANVNSTGEIYTLARFPGLRGFL